MIAVHVRSILTTRSNISRPPDQALWALRFYGLEKTAPVPGGSSPLPEKVKRSQHSSAHRRKRGRR